MKTKQIATVLSKNGIVPGSHVPVSQAEAMGLRLTVSQRALLAALGYIDVPPGRPPTARERKKTEIAMKIAKLQKRLSELG